MKQPVERRLAAILAADVAGYSRLMGLDEAGTAQALREHRAAADPVIAQQGGRIVKTTGDGVLIEFGSVVGAVQCAMALQLLAVERNAATADERRMEWRIGVHLGDVLVEGDDILGDGVNIAARLEGIAEPGGICISDDAFRQVRGKIEAEFVDIGEQSLKNIARPLRVYHIGPSPATEQPTISPNALPLPDKPSIAVLPFANMSGDPEQEFFSHGIAEDIVTALSRYPSLFVIARNSSFTYKGRSIDVKRIGRDLGVRYVLEGSLRKSSSQIRVTAQLIEAETGNHLWAERYDRGLADIFAVQDEITEAVSIAVAPAIDGAERRRAIRRPPENLDAWAAYQQGKWHLAKTDAAANDQARQLFERAIQLDPMFAAAYAGLARVYGYAGVHYRNMPRDEALRLNLMYARKAVEPDPGDADAQAELSVALIWQGDLENAQVAARQAIALNPNCAYAHACLGTCLVFTGQRAEGRNALSIALRLSPRDQTAADGNHVIAQSYYFDRNYDQCIVVLRRQLSAYPNYPLTYGWLASALGQLGRTEEASAAFHKAIVFWGEHHNPRNRFPFHSPDDHEHLLEGLRKAGWEG